jgi:hypothetical protein
MPEQTDSEGYLWISLSKLADIVCDGLVGDSYQHILSHQLCYVPVPLNHESETFIFCFSKC